MIVCESPEFVSWHPNLASSGQPTSTWTRLVCDGVSLCNALEWVDWLEDPVQVRICEVCGHPGCERGGYVRITRLGSHLLWTRPRVDIDDQSERAEFDLLHDLQQAGAVLIHTRAWEHWRTRFGDLPEPSSFAPASRWDLAQAWLMDAPLVPRPVTPARRWLDFRFARRQRRTTLEERETTLADARIAAQDLPEQDRDAVERLISWFEADPEAPVAGALFDNAEAKVETLELDLGHVGRWRAIASRDGRLSPLLGGAWLLVPEPIALNS